MTLKICQLFGNRQLPRLKKWCQLKDFKVNEQAKTIDHGKTSWNELQRFIYIESDNELKIGLKRFVKVPKLQIND